MTNHWSYRHASRKQETPCATHRWKGWTWPEGSVPAIIKTSAAPALASSICVPSRAPAENLRKVIRVCSHRNFPASFADELIRQRIKLAASAGALFDRMVHQDRNRGKSGSRHGAVFQGARVRQSSRYKLIRGHARWKYDDLGENTRVSTIKGDLPHRCAKRSTSLGSARTAEPSQRLHLVRAGTRCR